MSNFQTNIPLPEPLAYIREWDGDDSDLGQWLAVGDRDECDDVAPWHPVVALDQLLSHREEYAAARVAELEAEVSRLREDAERYRYLREHNGEGVWLVTKRGVQIGGYCAIDRCFLDAAIDAARAALKEQEQRDA